MRKVLLMICLLSAGMIMQAQQLSVGGGGQLVLSSGSPLNYSGLTLTPSSNFIINDGSLTMGPAVTNTFASPYLQRVFSFNTTPPAFSGSIRINYLDAELNGLNESNLQLYVNNGTSWKNFATAFYDPSHNYLQVNGISNQLLGELMLAGSTALPLHWGQAFAIRKGAQVQIKWSTSQEINVSHFDVERSTDARQWLAAITNIPAKNSTSITQYESTDQPAHNGRLFYRIRQTDLDGRSSLTGILVVPGLNEAPTLHLSPNPVHDHFILSVADISSIVRVDMLTTSGTLIHSWKGNQYLYKLPASAAGTYFIRIQTTDGKTESKKILIR